MQSSFPIAVIRGLLTAIGILLILKQIPHLAGYDVEQFGAQDFFERDQDFGKGSGVTVQHEKTALSILAHTIGHVEPGALLIGLICLAIMFFWPRFRDDGKLHALYRFLPAPLAVVVVGTLLNKAFSSFLPSLALTGGHLVELPQIQSIEDFLAAQALPNFAVLDSLFRDVSFWKIAFTIAIVASLESLLSVEAIDRIDGKRRRTPLNRELLAQGAGNFFSGALGGTPVTALIARSSINAAAGARTKLSTVSQGVLLLFTFIFRPNFVNHIPFACLAAILIHTGLQIIDPRAIREVSRKRVGAISFGATVLGVFFLDLFFGVVIGLITAGIFILRSSFHSATIHMQDYGRRKKITFGEDVTFLHKAKLTDMLASIPAGSIVEIDGSKALYIDTDIINTIADFQSDAVALNVDVIVGGIKELSHYGDDTKRSMAERYKELLQHNKEWVKEKLEQDPTFFERSTEGQTPNFLFIGCSDSRVPINVITKTDPGDLFVHRNIANIVSLSDINLLSVLQYSVEVLNVRHVIVCGHYHCGGVKAALEHRSFGLIDNWISSIKHVVEENREELEAIKDPHQRERRTIELHAINQVKNLSKTSIVQKAIKKNGFPFLHAWVYDISTGYINDLCVTVDPGKDLDPVFRFD